MSILQKVFSKRAICAALFVLFAVCCAVSFFLREVSAETIPAVESGPVYSVQNITKDATCEVDFINDYFGYSAPYDSSTYERSLVAYTYDAAEDGVITLKTANISFPGQDTYLLAEPAEGGNYTVTEIGRFSTDATPTADGYSITIPADGYALVTTNATSATPFSTNGQGNFVEGDTVSGIQDNSRWSFTDTTSGYSLKLTHEVTTSGMMDVDGSGALNGHYAVINRTAGTYVEMYSTRSYIVAQASGEGSYTISDVYATGTDTAAVNATRVNVPEGGFIVGLGYCYAGQRQYAKGGFITAAEVGDTIEFTDREAADPSTGITVTADNTPAEINAVNPEDVTVGQTALYCNVLNDYSGSGLLNTPERTDETVYEYVVMVIGDIEDGEHRIVEVRHTEGAIPAHGYVISAAKDLGWAVGDIATLSSTALPDGTEIAVFDMSLDFPDLGQRIMLTYKNHEITDGNRVVLSDTAVAGDVSSQKHAWSFDISCEYNEGRTGGTVTQITNRTDGTMGTTPIPEGGFVIYSHGSLNRTLIEQLRVGYSIIINDFNEESDAVLTSVTIDGTDVPFENGQAEFSVTDQTRLQELVANMQFASEYGKASVQVGQVENYTLPLEVTVTATSPNEYFSNTYTVRFVEYVVPSTGITVTAGNTPAEINAVNPEDVTVGQTALYCNVLNDYSGSGLLNTPERTDETVYEYVVMVIGDIEDGEHRIVEVRHTEGAIPAHGYVISAAKDLGWAVGDIATLSSTALPDGTEIAVFDMSLDFPDLGQRIMLTYKNHEITDGNRVVLSDTAVAGDVSSQKHAWSFDISCEYNEGRTGGTVTQITNRTDGTMGTTPIPEGGFVIYSHGSLNRTLIEQLRVGYSIIINDFNEQSDSFLTSVTIGETVIPFAGEGDFYTDYKVEDASQLETIIAGMQFASEYGKADIEVGAIESYTLPMEVTVTLTSPNGYFSNEYTIVFKVETSEDARLASVTVGDAALQSFAAETKNYTVDYAIGEALPTVAATAADAGATVSIQQATTENPQAVITVTAEDESFVWTYTIQFRVVDNTLSELWIGETKLTDFSPLQSEYTFSHSLRMIDGKVVWSIKNPANSAENLADKWCKDSKYATEFFRWVKQAQIDLVDILEGDNKFEDVRAKLKYCLDVDIENILIGFNFSEISQPRPFNMQRDIPKPYNVTYEL